MSKQTSQPRTTTHKLAKRPRTINQPQTSTHNHKSLNMKLSLPFVFEKAKEGENGLLLPRKWLFQESANSKKKYWYMYRDGKISSMRRIRRNQIYIAILDLVSKYWLYSWEIAKFIKESDRTLRYHLSELIRLKWIIRRQGNKYMLNPFLEFLVKNHGYIQLYDYASYKIDFFRLLNYPLRLIKNPIEFKAKVYWQKKPDTIGFGKLPTDPNMVPVFHGMLLITAKMPNDLEIQTFLPINMHYDYLDNPRMKQRIINPHLCVPCDWSLFNVKESTYYSGFSPKANRQVMVHFDNSITIMYFKDYSPYLMFKKPYEKAVEKWNGSEYVECTNTDTLEKLFTLRFKEGYTRTQLFEKMGLTLKHLGRAT